MSNIFKKNSRFAALADEIKEIKKNNEKQKNTSGKQKNKTENTNITTEGNIFKTNYYDKIPKRNYESRSINQQNDRKLSEERLEKKREKELEDKRKQLLSSESFPELITNKSENKLLSTMNYLNKLKTEGNESIKSNKNELDLEYENLKPGWAVAKKDLVTGKIITKYKPSLNQAPREKTQQEIGLDIINALVELHEKRKEEYINMWGYDTWEKMYRFPNYDYDYFNKLDELYEEMEDEESDNVNSDNDMYY